MDEKFCYFPMYETCIQATYAPEYPHGYKFISTPCWCYSNVCTDLNTIHRIETADPWEIITSYKRTDFLNKILRGDYSSCTNCPRFRDFHDTMFVGKPNFDNIFGERSDEFYDLYTSKELKNIFPYTISLNLDDACNYACPTCRKSFIKQLYAITQEDADKIVDIIKHVSKIVLSGSGEFFATRNYDRILSHDLTENSILKEISFFTNASMFTETNWNKINETNKKLIKEIRVSIDAATEETYRTVRSAISWPRVLENLKYMNTLKEKYGFTISSNFTISKYNISDVSKFYDFAVEHGIDTVLFSFARPIFHGTEADSDFIIPLNERDDILTYIKELQNNVGITKVFLF